MRIIDLETWQRRKHFDFFSTLDYPHFNMCVNIDLTSFLPGVERNSTSFTVALIYFLMRAANEIPEFRYRIRPGQVVEHDTVHPSTTILTSEDLFSFCTMVYNQDFSIFASAASKLINDVQQRPVMENEVGRDDLIYMTAIPWVSFTSFMHPVHLSPVDSFPRFAWGKYFPERGRVLMPLSVQAHHALMDGLHVGKYYQLLQEYLSDPDKYLAPQDARRGG